ncbi:MAG: U32 family peptidase [Anaerovoracaceae bacterium]
MTELLAPAGSMEALKAAVSNGCDAVYLGMQRFGARAYSSNFDEDTLREAVRYCHLRDVKVYVTMNTIVFEDELADMKEQLQLINALGVDAVIVQDMAVAEYITDHFEDMEVHCSTQMGLDDLDGALLWKELGAKRVVLARELPLDEVKEIRRQAKIPVEVFVHGALCVSYSGNCLMSGLIGYRSGNRGRCVGSCRKLYEVFNLTKGQSLGSSYILSTKDLKTYEHVDELRELDSLKIEGRMKEPAYVANVVAKYRRALDGTAQPGDGEGLDRTFNRTYTKGYMFGEDKKNITNIFRPNNYGFAVGHISGVFRGKYEITLHRPLNQNDIIRIDHNNEDVNLSVVKLYDRGGNLINGSDSVCYIRIKEKLSVGDIVYKTKDYQYYKELETHLDQEFRRFPLDLQIYAYPESPLTIDARGLGVQYFYEGTEPLQEAEKKPTSKEQIVRQFGRLNDTIFTLNRVEYEECGAFLPASLMNSARRDIVQGLCEAKLAAARSRTKTPAPKTPVSFALEEPFLTASVLNQEQYDACVRAGVRVIYFKNIIRRNENHFTPQEGELLIGGYGGIHHYRETNPFVTDYSLNVVNASSCRQLHRLGAKRITLSYELNRRQIRDLLDAYLDENGGYPSLEMIVYGRAPLMFTKYCPLKKLDQCGSCRTCAYELRDEYGTFPVISHEDCTTTILNGRILNLLDEIPSMEGIQAFRLSFTTETPQEVEQIVRAAAGKLAGTLKESLFDRERDTRGHFNKEII